MPEEHKRMDPDLAFLAGQFWGLMMRQNVNAIPLLDELGNYTARFKVDLKNSATDRVVVIEVLGAHDEPF